MNQGTFPVHSSVTRLQPSQLVGPLQGSSAFLPIFLYAKNIPVRTAGTTAAGGVDIATIQVPSNIPRYSTVFGNNSLVGGWFCLMETSSINAGLGGTFTVKNGPAGSQTATNVYNGLTPPTTFTSIAGASAISATTFYTAPTLYINQTADSTANGTLSFYLCLCAIP